MKKIKKIKLKNFKRYKHFELELNDEKNILIGDNEAGKSSILTALNLILNRLKATRLRKHVKTKGFSALGL